jgi:tetratricopeptide (TPR) repeat protein
MERLHFKAGALSIAILLALFTGCATTHQRGKLLTTTDAAVEKAASADDEEDEKAEPSAADANNYAVSHGKGSVIDVPFAPEDAAVFHFSLGQAYSLDNDPQRAIEAYRATLVHDPKSALVRARLAAELVKVGNFAEARKLCEEAIKLDGKYLDSYLLLAGIQVAAKEYDSAIATYKSALKIDPKSRDALLYLGVTLAEVGQTKEGITELEKLVKVKDSAESNIDQSVAFYYLAKVYEQSNQRDKAIKAYVTALKKRPGFSKAALALSDLYVAHKQVAKAYEVLEEAFAEGRSAEIAERLAERHLEQNDYQGAVTYLETLVDEDPTNENMKLRLSLVYWQVGWLDKAEALLKDLHDRYNASSEISYYLGELSLERGNFQQAIRYYKQVGPDYAKYDQMVSRVAFTYRQQGKLVEAEDYLLDSIKKRPDVVAFYPLLAAVFEDEKKIDDARLVLEKGEKLFPNDENVLYYLGFTLDRLGQKDKALAKMEHLLSVNPDNANALNFVGYTLVELNTRMNEAEKFLARAVSLKPDDAFILDSYGWLLYRQGKSREAMKQLERAYANKPEEGVIAEHLADIYVALNLPRKALSVYEQALKGSSGDKEFVTRVEGKLSNVREVLAGDGTSSPLGQASPAHSENGQERVPASK